MCLREAVFGNLSFVGGLLALEEETPVCGSYKID